ncbi:MAG TPA: hypothetical protein VNS63_26165, partial [Blastocatellia bacterium]|nr:hypothetical protein [Blastocatellia bacterium]
MRELQFLITGFSEDDARRWRRRGGRPTPARAATWTLLALALLYLQAAKPGGRVDITSPVNGATTLNTQITVSGNAIGIQADAITLKVNGSLQTVSAPGGSFEAQVPLVLGDNTLVAEANGISSEPITILRKAQPVVKISSPSGATRTTRSEIEVVGAVENTDQRVVSLDVNGRTQAAAVAGARFSTTVPLTVGRNTIQASVAGATPAAVEVSRLETGIAISSPSDGYSTDRASVTVTGIVENSEAAAVTLKSNDSSRSVPVQNGGFVSEVGLALGDNVIRVSVGEVSSDQIVVHRKLPPVIITLTSPQNGSTQSAVVSVQGTVENARTSTITLMVNGSPRNVPLAAGGFAAEVRLVVGENRFRASQGDALSNEVVVVRQPLPTLIEITSPRTGRTQNSSVRVAGKVTNPRGQTITLSVNGSSQVVQLAGAGFAATVGLVVGDNRLQASQGDAVSNEVVVNRQPLPTLIEITSPRTGRTQESSVRVSGNVTNPRGQTITLTINGSPQLVQLSGAVFTATVGLGVGNNRIQASQGDAVSNEVIVSRIEQRTLIRITSPANGRTQDSSVRVTGTVVNPRGGTIKLTVNDSSSDLALTNGGFTSSVKLQLGDNRIQASQGDAQSNVVVVSRIEQQRTLIKITSPANGRTQDSSVRVTGTVQNPRGGTISLTVNGSSRDLTITNGSFASSAKLQFGDNHIQASQGDAVSNVVVVSRIEQLRTLIKITSPAKGRTRDSSVRVTGTVQNPRGGTIKLTVNGSSSEVSLTNGGFASS